jgi:hypothetical protein
VLKTHKQLNPQEQAEAIKLKAEIDRLTSGAWDAEAVKQAVVGKPDRRLPEPRQWPRNK